MKDALHEEAGDVDCIDTVMDSIRDDVMRWICNRTAPGPQRDALKQLARALQETLAVNSRHEAYEQAVKVVRAQECVFSHFEEEAARTGGDLRAVVVNTEERGRAFLGYNELVAGESFPTVDFNRWSESCQASDGTERTGDAKNE